jgi:hypothetical protein
MINPFIIKKYGALLTASVLTTIIFFMCLTYLGFLIALGGMLIGALISVFIGSALLANPFTKMLEGQGLLVLKIDSTGIIEPFNVVVQQPYIKGNIQGQEVNDIFNREAVYSLTTPKHDAGKAIISNEGKVDISLDERDYNKARFQLFQYPCLIYNNQIKSLLTKDWLSDQEKSSFAEHGVLYQNRKLEELTSAMRDFGRYVVDQLRPKQGLNLGKWGIIILIVVLGILAVLFAPKLYASLTGTVNSAANIAGNAVITPK